MDLLYVVITIAFFGLTWGIVKLCESLAENPRQSRGLTDGAEP